MVITDRHSTFDDMHRSMPWDGIDTVVFDVGGVLVDMGFDGIYRIYPEKPFSRREKEFYRCLMFRSPYWAMLDRGSTTLEKAIDAMSAGHPEKRDHIAHIARHWMEYKSALEEGTDILEICRQHGKRLIALSNYPEYAFDHIFGAFPFFSLFDGVVVSSKEGLLKPDPAIYNLTQERYSLVPSRTLMIDDSPANVESALHCGWQAICADRPGKLYRFFTNTSLIASRN